MSAAPPILERVYAALRPVVDEIVLVGDAPLPSAWHVLRVPDELPGGGPLAALHTGMKALPGEQYIALAWDMPFVTTPLLAYLLAHSEGVDAVVPSIRGRDQPLCALYASASSAAITQALAAGQRRLGSFLSHIRMRRLTEADLAPFGDPRRLFFNVNTPQDYM